MRRGKVSLGLCGISCLDLTEGVKKAVFDLGG